MQDPSKTTFVLRTIYIYIYTYIYTLVRTRAYYALMHCIVFLSVGVRDVKRSCVRWGDTDVGDPDVCCAHSLVTRSLVTQTLVTRTWVTRSLVIGGVSEPSEARRARHPVS